MLIFPASVTPFHIGLISAQPSISLNPSSGPAGTLVTVTGTGFAPNTNISIKMMYVPTQPSNAGGPVLPTACPECPPLASASTDSSGSFQVTFTVPAEWSPGNYEIYTVGGGGQATFTVTPGSATQPPQSIPPSPSVQESISVTTDKYSYNEGDTMTISGNVNPVVSGEVIVLHLLLPNGQSSSPADVSPNSDGSYSTIIKIFAANLNLPSGVYTVTATYAGAQSQIRFSYYGSSQPQATPQPTVPQPSKPLAPNVANTLVLNSAQISHLYVTMSATNSDPTIAMHFWGEATGSAASWVQPQHIDFGTLYNDQSQRVDYTITVPPDTQAGNYELIWKMGCTASSGSCTPRDLIVPITVTVPPQAQPSTPSLQQQTAQSTENTADYKKMECVDKYGTGFYYDAAQYKCFPPSGSWQNPGIDYYNNYCHAQYGSGFYFDTSQNACLPPSGSWQNAGPTYYDHQCEDNFWPDFHYDASQNACIPPSGSWQNFAPPQTGITDQQGTVTFQIAGQSVPFKFADDKTGSSLSGLEVSFALDAKTQSIGTLLIIDPTKHYPMQIITLTGSPSSNSNIPTAWQSRLIPHAYAQTSLTNQALIYLDDHPLAVASMAVLAGGLLTGGGAGLVAAAGALEVVDLAVESVKLAARAADKAGWLLPVGILGKGVETKIVSPDEANKEAAVEAGVGTGKANLLLAGTIKETSGKMYGANLVGSFLNGALDAYTISHCDTTNNNIYKEGFAGESFYTCKAKDDTYYGTFDYNPPETEHVSLELVSKANKGFFESVQTDSGTPIPVPADDYSVRISAPGKQPINQDVQITPQQTTTVKTILQAIPSNNVAVNPPQIQVLGGTCTVNQYCDILIATATDGLAPYYFKSDTFANGAPPFGMTVGIYGHLTGTPTQPGQYNVPVCVVDTAGKSSCDTATVTVNPQEQQQQPQQQNTPGTFRSCIYSHFSSPDIPASPPSCSDTSDQPEPTMCNGKDIGTVRYDQVQDLC